MKRRGFTLGGRKRRKEQKRQNRLKQAQIAYNRQHSLPFSSFCLPGPLCAEYPSSFHSTVKSVILAHTHRTLTSAGTRAVTGTVYPGGGSTYKRCTQGGIQGGYTPPRAYRKAIYPPRETYNGQKRLSGRHITVKRGSLGGIKRLNTPREA